jgi:hypothetical protein
MGVHHAGRTEGGESDVEVEELRAGSFPYMSHSPVMT